MEAPDGCPQEIYSIMMLAWEIDPKQRPTFKQVLEKLNNLRATTVGKKIQNNFEFGQTLLLLSQRD
jgi:hypothetical protein